GPPQARRFDGAALRPSRAGRPDIGGTRAGTGSPPEALRRRQGDRGWAEAALRVRRPPVHACVRAAGGGSGPRAPVRPRGGPAQEPQVPPLPGEVAPAFVT